jgi:molecular chaperone GrpE
MVKLRTGKGVHKKSSKKSTYENVADQGEDLEQLKGQLARVLADYSNLEKRVEREREGFFKFANADLIKRLLPIIDMLEQAQTHLADPGLAIAIKEFKDLLKEDGVEEIYATEGDEYSEELFEAIEAIDSIAENKQYAGKVAEMVLSGWKYSDGTVIRPVKVKVYNKK